MKKINYFKVIPILLLLSTTLVFGLFYLSSILLISRFNLEAQGIHPYFWLAIDMAKHGVKFQKLAGFIACLVSLGLPIVFFAVILRDLLLGEKRELHGSAKLATTNDLVKAGLLEKDKKDDEYPSIIVGITDDQRFLLFKGMQFVMLAAETRSGKGVGIVIPNLLHYRDSVVVLDIKGENFAITSGFRKQCGQEVYRFSPDNENFETDCWNPLDYVRKDPIFRLSDLLSITNMLYPPSFDSPWSSTAENLFLGIALYILDTEKELANFNISSIKKMAVTLPFLKDEDSLNEYVKSREGLEPLSEEAVVYLKGFVQNSEKVRSSILISFNQPLGVFGDPITANATSKSTFNLQNVRKKRMSIYISIKPTNIETYGVLLNLFFQQLLNLNMKKLPSEDPSLKYQCLFVLDEFAAMGRIPVIEKASAYMAGYNLRLLLIFQNKSQIRDHKLYGKEGAKTIMGNMALQIIFAPREDDEAKEYSEMIGYMTWKGKSISGKKQWFGGALNNHETTSDQRRAVLLPQEIKEMGQDAAIISMSNMKPAKVKKIRWYEEPIFQERANLPPPKIPTQMFIKHGTQKESSFDIPRFESLECLSLNEEELGPST